MDALLSLPIISYLFSPAPSWSTSLNILFFQATWSTLVLSHSPLKIELISITAIRLIFWLIPSLIFLLFDSLLPSLAVSLKYNGSSALPPRDARALAKLLGLALLNLVVETAVEAAISLGLIFLLKEPPFRPSTTLPLPWQMVKHITSLFASREILAYYIHRYLLHNPGGRWSRSLEKLHTRFAHSRAAPPFSLLLMADHPLPSLLLRLLPTYGSGLALALFSRRRLHFLTYLVFVALATLEETLATSGYTVVPGIVMGGIARRTATHYCRPGAGNFSPWGVLDWVHGTSLGGDVLADVRDEAAKHGVSGAGGGASGMAEGLKKRRGRKDRGNGN